MGRAVFLDRDDTLIATREATAGSAYPGDLADPALVRLLPGVAEGLRAIKGAGYLLVVVSNQGCVARGVCGVADVEAVNARMEELVRDAAGVRLDVVLFCPYHPAGVVPPWNVEHEWRKPRPGMMLEAARRLSLDLEQCWMIGDSARDVEAAVSAGIPARRAIRVGSEGGPDFGGAVRRVLAEAAPGTR